MSKAFKKISQIGNKEQIEVVLATVNFYTHGVCLKSDGITLTANTRTTKRTPENPNLSTEGFDVISFEEGDKLYKDEILSLLFEAAEESPLVPGHEHSEVAHCGYCYELKKKKEMDRTVTGYKCDDCQISEHSWCTGCNKDMHLHKMTVYANGKRLCASCEKELSTAKANNN